MPAQRTVAKLIRLTPSEFAEIERRAHDAGQLPARYIRECALHPIAAPTSNAGATRDLLHTLTTIGADLKTLVRTAPDDTVRTAANRVLDHLLTVLHQLTTRPTP